MKAVIGVQGAVARARSALGQGVRYELGRGGFRPEAASPAPNGECDCSGFVAWCLGIPRKWDKPFYECANGGWFETSAICEDLRSPLGNFEKLAEPEVGCIAVYGDHHGRQGHIGIVTQVRRGRAVKVIHCSRLAWRTKGDAIQEDASPALLTNPNVLFGRLIQSKRRPSTVPRAIVVNSAIVTPKALQLLLDFEGLDQPSQWPGGNSGISLGRGYDLGYHTHDELMADWAGFLTEPQLARLASAIGRRGKDAKTLAANFTGIVITRAAADEVFTQATLPKIRVWAVKAFPGILDLPPDAQGALVSLVYNRGTSMHGDRRREMLAIRGAIADRSLPMPKKLVAIAAQLRFMKRLWPDLKGLQRRREAEAVLLENARF